MITTRQIVGIIVVIGLFFLPAGVPAQGPPPCPVCQEGAPAIEVPRTGQTTCYNTAGNPIDCTGTGQDGDIQAGVAWPDPRFTDIGDGTIKDNLTGLIWLKDANCIQTQYPGFDNDGTPGGGVSWQRALDFVAGINDGTYPNCGAGHTDWRLGNINELGSLTHFGVNQLWTWLMNQGFINVQPNYYWSSTTSAYASHWAWILEILTGNSLRTEGDKRFSQYVWPLRGTTTPPAQVPKTGQVKCYRGADPWGEIPCAGTGQDGEIQAGAAWPLPRFTDNSDGTITDNLTRLMWLKDANCFGGKTWQGALDTVSDLNANPAAYSCGGYTAIHDDWRLTNPNEFASIFNYQDYNLTWFNNPSHFSNVIADWYWTSTNKVWSGYVHSAWVGGFYWGSGGVDFAEKFRGGTFLWPVRTVPAPPKVADIAVTKTDNPDPVAVGQNLTYTVTVTNNGPDTATDVTVTDTLPANITFISATPSQGTCSENCRVVTCNLGELAATSLATVTIVVIPAAPGVIYNTAEASAIENDVNPSNNTQTIPTVVIPSPYAPDISVSPASHDFGSIAVGSSSSKTFLITNEGTAGLTLGNLSIIGPQASEFSLGSDTCSGQVIPINKTCVVDVVFRPASEGPKNASLSIPSDDPDESPLLVSLSGGDYTVHLHSRTFSSAPGISTAAREAIINSGLSRVHVLVQTKRVPTTGEVSEFTTMGLRLLVFIPNLTFLASLPTDAQSVDAIAAHPVIRSVMLITPEDRIAGNIKDGIDARLQYPDGTVALEIDSFFDVPMAEARGAIASLVTEILAESERIRGFLVRASPGAITPLSQSDVVQLISEVAPPPQDDNDQIRIVTNVSNVQIVEDTTDAAGNMTGTQPGAPYALDGAGVGIGQWEALHPDCSHPDFFGTLDSTGTITGTNPRVTYGDANVDCRSPSYSAAGDTTIGDHATHVAGIVLGNGSQSAGAGGLALQWRGMAPNASIIAYQRPDLDPDDDGVADAAPRVTHQAQYDNAIAAGIVLSTNSWGFSHCHQVGGSCYERASAMYDSIITDPFDPDQGDALSIIASAGNCGPGSLNVTRCETTPGGGVWPNWGTVRVPNSAKNTIVVGNVFSDTRALVGSSSRGPVDDGRIKPEVVAPGDQAAAGLSIRSTVMTIFTDDAGSDGAQGAGCASNGNGGDIPLPIDDCAFPYDDIGGTSMSTPATTGGAALLVQQFRTRRGADPWPSTVKALLIHTAIDQCCTDSFQVGGAALDPDTPGPDYSFGYGLIDVQAGLDLLRNRRNGHVVQSDGFAGWGACTTQPYDPCDYDGDGVGDSHIYRVTLPAGTNYRVTLVYDDLPGAGGQLDRGIRALVNDLDLFLVAPDGSISRPWVLDPANPANAATTGIDNRNPVEVVDITNAAGGEWAIVVRPIRLMPLFFGPAQRYTLIYETFKPDLMIRDHEFDNGGVPSAWGGGEVVWMPARPWNSPDIILEGEDAITPGVERAVQVAVNNIGEFKVNNVTVNLYWANTGIGADYADYLAHPMGSCVIASLDPGQRSNHADCRILYTWNVGDLPFTEGRKYVCLLATVETAGDEITYPGNDTLPEGANPHHFYIWDNNIAQKNSIKVVVEPDGGGGDIGFEIRNPGLATAVIDIVQDTSKLPDGWEVQIFPSSSFSLPPGGKSWAKVTLVPPPLAPPGSQGWISLYGWNQTTGELLGGFDAAVSVPRQYTHTVTSDPSGLQVSVDGSSYTAPQTFSWSAGSMHTISIPSPQYSVDQQTKHTFASWSDGGSQTHQITASSSNVAYTAAFNTEYLLNTTVNPLGSGSITLNPSGPWYNPGQSVELTATASSGYSYSRWSGDLSGSTNPASLTMNGPRNVRANFIQTPPPAAATSYGINAHASYSYIRGDTLIPSANWQGNLGEGYYDLVLGDFDFNFYGAPVTIVRILTKGYLTFSSEGSAGANTQIPNTDPPNALIAPYWDDLDLSSCYGISCGVWWSIVGTAPDRQLVIEWYQVPSGQFHSEAYSFEIILYESTDKIKFQYADVDSGTSHDFGASATVGIENFDGTRGVQYSFNGSTPLYNGLAIEFVPHGNSSIVDFDGDGKSDIAVYNKGSGWWFIMPSGGAPYGVGWGGDASDIPVSGDYDGDGSTDVAIYRGNTGVWWITPSSGAPAYPVGWGGPGYKPIPGDYDGDGKADISIYETGTGVWWIIPSSGTPAYGVGWGGAGFTPVPADYDGDGKADIAIYGLNTGVWWIIPSSGAPAYGVGWGGAGYTALPADYDGDGKADIAIYESGTGIWWIIPSSGSPAYGVGWGGPVFTPVPGDYDGDGKADIAIYEPSTGAWWMVPSSGAPAYGVGWGGAPGDVPITANVP